MVPTATLAAFLGVTGEDAYLAALEDGVVAEVAALTGLHLEPRASVEEIHDGQTLAERLTERGVAPEPQRVYLTQPPAGGLDDVTKVEERGGTSDVWEDVPLEEDGEPVFELEGRVLIRRIGEWPAGPRTVRVTYARGWDEPEAEPEEDYVPIPPELSLLVRDLVAHRYRGAAMRRLGGEVTAASIRGASFTLGGRGNEAEAQEANGMNMPRNLALRMDRLPGSQSARRSRR